MTSIFARSTASDIVELLAENGEQRFLIHRDILVSQSKPFQEAITGVWKEATQRKIDLGDWDGDTVGRLVEFLYTGNYPYPDPEPIFSQKPQPAHRNSSAQESAIQKSVRSKTPSRESELYTSRPLTPLNDWILSSVPPVQAQETDTTRLESFDPTHHDYKETLLVHARVYVLAHYKSIDALCELATRRILITLSTINPVQPDSHIPSNIAYFAKYIYENTDCLTRSEEPLRRIISQFVALNLLALQRSEEFMDLIRGGGDFISDVMAKVCRRLRANDSILLRSEARFVSSIRIEYGTNLSDRPIHHLQELGGGSSNICDGVNGRYVWLVPEYTVFPDAACTAFKFKMSKTVDSSRKNLAEGCSDVFRYIIPIMEEDRAEKITMIALLRARSGVLNSASTEYGSFDGMTEDINDANWNQSGDYLYLLIGATTSTGRWFQ